ncbi:MAG TPA: ATP-dependent helicase, partial [Acidobacteria bacterium]|nr:ATP-dependent helicase [Acidobacteriota bacterium]
TFTNKAAAEMRERVDHLLGRRADRAHLCTFHSFATDVLRQHGSHLGIRPDFTLLTLEDDRVAILAPLAEGLEREGHSPPADRKNLLSILDHLFAEAYDGADETPSLVQTPPWVPTLFSRYCQALVGANRLDFGTLLHFARKLLKEKPGVARVLRLAWPYVCVDEFQDTNKAQYELLRLLVGAGRPNLFVVADDDQIIYQWNGASPERLDALRGDFEIGQVELPENYRCPAQIIEIANRLIEHNRRRTAGKKPLAAARPPGLGEDVIRFAELATPFEEAAFVARDLLARGLRPGSCAVLARTAKLLEGAASALQVAGLEAYVAQRKTEFSSPAVCVVFNALRLANARHDRDVLRRLCVAWHDLTGALLEVEDVAAAAGLVGGDFLRAWSDAARTGDVDSMAAALLARIRAALVDRLDFLDFVDGFLTKDWKAWSQPEVDEEVNTWSGLHQDIVREHAPDDLTLNLYLQQMDLVSKAPSPPPGAIRCMTVHGAKGLEFQHVYLIGMAEEVFPSYQAVKKGPESREMEEERRNCFVAITRVQETLTLTRAREYNGWRKAPSRFLEDMGLPAQP